MQFQHLSQSHNIKLFKGNLCISSNLGLHIYDLTTNKLYLNLIKKEINNRSLNIINDTIKAGTLNGILQISENNLIDLLNDSKISVRLLPIIIKAGNQKQP